MTGPNWPNTELLTNGGITVYMVAMQDDAGGTLDSNGRFINAGPTTNINLQRNGTADEYSATLRGGSPAITGAITDGTFYTFRLRNDLSTTYVAINDGLEQSRAATGPSTVTNPTYLFAGISSGFGNKSIAEIMVFTENHDASKIAIVESYLKTKYNHY
jgi:hypothetical protein